MPSPTPYDNERVPSIAAVVVTHNRLPLLQECVAALQAQTRPLQQIIVVDNASTDATSDWLTAQPGLTVIHQENLGSGGGQHTGIKAAFDLGHDWCWCMDDDGEPAHDALGQLVAAMEPEDAWLNCLVMDRHHPDVLPFSLPGVGRDAVAARRLSTISGATPFNGTLIARQLVDTIGCPAPDLFIWGDEAEYRRRALKAGYRLRTITAAIHYHPSGHENAFATTPINRCWKFYYYVRNYEASADTRGKVSLNPKASTGLGLRLIGSLWKRSWRTPILNCRKAQLIMHAMLASARNDLRRAYP